MRPRIKHEHRPVRCGPDRIRIGGIVRGIAADIPDPDGWVWALLECLDGTRTVDQLTAELVHRFPAHPAEHVRDAIEDLDRAGYLYDADANVPTGLTPAQQHRYSRGQALFDWMDRTPGRNSWHTQLLLRQARVVVIGIGGAGSTAALALTTSGVGHVHCVDPDTVELSNLNRQILFTEHDLGRAKVTAALDRLRAHNSEVALTGEALTIDGPATLRTLAARFDLLVLTADRPEQIRSWTNHACGQTGTAWVHAGYHGPQINIGLYRPGTGPCYDCAQTAEQHRRASLPPRTPWTPAATASPVQAANAVTAGIAGYLAAHAAMSLITGAPALPSNRQYGFNLVTLQDSVALGPVAPRPDCPTCQSTRP